ncbi:MAG: AAA family ATPase [Bacillota bacterium]
MNFFKKKEKPRKQEEGIVLWQAGRGDGVQSGEGIKGEVKRLLNLPVSPGALPGHGRIFTVQSAVKGDGASTVAVNLAGVLAISSPERVILVDLDGYGAVRSRMGLPAGECLVNILDWEDIHSPRDMVRGLYTHTSGVLVVPGVIHLEHVEKVTPALVFKMLTLLKESYDYIILDCPPVGIHNNTWAAALVSDVILTVFRPDRTSIDLINENNGLMSRLGCQERVYAVLNQAGIPGGIRAGEVESRLGIDIIAVLPYSIGVAEENNRRQMIIHNRHKDEFTKAVHVLADKFSARERAV